MNINELSNRTIFRVLAMITAFVVMIALVIALKRQLVWVLIAAFLAVALNPAIEWLRKYLPRKSRALATFLVVFGSVIGVAVLIAVFIPPLFGQATDFISNVPHLVHDLSTSNAPLARLLQRYDVVNLLQKNQDKITQSLSNLGTPLVNVLRSTASSLVAMLSILSLTFFMLIEGPQWIAAFKKSRWGKQYAHHEPLVAQMYRAVTGYVTGNVLTSLVAAIAAVIPLVLLGVPYALPLALVVGLCDLLPLIGATLGAAIVLIVCLFHSLSSAVIMLVFFLIYQQFENQILQPLVYARTVQISPLIVFVAALLGASLAGLFGALIAIPVAASLKLTLEYYLDSTR